MGVLGWPYDEDVVMPSEMAKRMNAALERLRRDVGTPREAETMALMRALVEQARGQR